MMRIIVFSTSRTIQKRFAAIERARSIDVSFEDPTHIRQIVKEQDAATIAYIDAGGVEKNLKKLVRDLSNMDHVRIGVLDLKNDIDDPAELFFEGAFDYIGKPVLSEEVSANRLKKAAEYRPQPESGSYRSEHRKEQKSKKTSGAKAEETAKKRFKNLSGSNWSDVKTGSEYTFVFLYIEIDLTDEWRTKSGKAHLDEVVSLFHSHVEKVIAPINGKVWMWTHTGGVVLFPFDGKNCPAIRTCFKLVLDSTITSAEEYPYKTLITYNMAVHIGNTVYRGRGNTGTIVSETVNFIFHLGEKFVKRGNFYVTEAAQPYIPKGLSECFDPAGSFENIDVWRMRLPKRKH